MSDINKKGNRFVLGAVIGAAAGAVTALLFAPKPGKELRRDLADGYSAVAGKTSEIAGEVGRKTQAAASQVKGFGAEWAGKARALTRKSAQPASATVASAAEAADSETDTPSAAEEATVAKEEVAAADSNA